MNLWDKRPDEPDKPYAMFLNFLSLAPHERSYRNAARVGQLAKHAMYAIYGRKFNWQARAAAYDADKAKREFEAMQLSVVQQKVTVAAAAALHTGVMSERVVALQTLVDKVIHRMTEQENIEVDDLQKVVKLQDLLDMMARRTLKMPTSYKVAKDAEQDTGSEDDVYIIGED